MVLRWSRWTKPDCHPPTGYPWSLSVSDMPVPSSPGTLLFSSRLWTSSWGCSPRVLWLSLASLSYSPSSAVPCSFRTLISAAPALTIVGQYLIFPGSETPPDHPAPAWLVPGLTNWGPHLPIPDVGLPYPAKGGGGVGSTSGAGGVWIDVTLSSLSHPLINTVATTFHVGFLSMGFPSWPHGSVPAVLTCEDFVPGLGSISINKAVQEDWKEKELL